MRKDEHFLKSAINLLECATDKAEYAQEKSRSLTIGALACLICMRDNIIMSRPRIMSIQDSETSFFLAKPLKVIIEKISLLIKEAEQSQEQIFKSTTEIKDMSKSLYNEFYMS